MAKGKDKGLRRKRVPSKKFKHAILIVCEDGKCATDYFKGIKNEWQLHLAKVELVVEGKECGSAPISVVDHAENCRKARQRDARDPLQRKVQFDQVWCVFDRDQHESYKRALDKATRNKYLSTAESVPCFEVWYLAHFGAKRHKYDNHDHVVHALRQKDAMPGFVEKSAPLDILLPLTDTALQNAKIIRDELKENPALEYSITKVDLLVSELKTLKSD